jgi:hypothetical protein
VYLSKMVQVSLLIEMLLNSHQDSNFQSSQPHHPNELQVMIKWMELLHVGEMVVKNEIP